jgi:FHS family glucose/mannose:H+ symporter-like MFS transporter
MAEKKTFPLFFTQFILLGLGASIFGPLIPVLSESFSVDLDKIGATLSLSAFGLLLTSLFTGILSERIGKKTAYIFGNLLFAACFLGLYFSTHFNYFTLSYILFGAAWGIIAVSSTTIISDAFHLNRSKMIMRLNTGFLLGAFIAPLLVSGTLYLNISWRYLFLSVSVLNILLLVSILLLKPESLHNIKHEDNFRRLLSINRKLLSNLTIILCGIINFMHLGAGLTFGSWLTTYLKNLNIPVIIGSLILCLYALTFAVGMFIKSFLFSRFSEKKIMQISAILAFVALTIFFFADTLILKTILIILFALSFSGIAAAAVSLGIHQNPRNSGSIISIINSFGFLGVVIFQYTAGYLAENFSVNSVIYICIGALFILIIPVSILNYSHRFIRK